MTNPNYPPRGPLAQRNRRLARSTLSALARMWCLVLDDLALYGEEEDDRPRLWLAEVERFGRGEQASIPGPMHKRLDVWRDEVWADGSTHSPLQKRLAQAMGSLERVRQRIMLCPTDCADRSAKSIEDAAAVMALTERETFDGAQHRCARWFAEATRAVIEQMASEAITDDAPGLFSQGTQPAR